MLILFIHTISILVHVAQQEGIMLILVHLSYHGIKMSHVLEINGMVALSVEHVVIKVNWKVIIILEVVHILVVKLQGRVLNLLE